ncbi:MAG: glycosyltransferase family 4 protein [Planctomycetes bacterium]|nr:glycosyltransferase family 4 protein [Planctomycetota bacterium]
MSLKSVIIHAENCRGLGARSIVVKLLEQLHHFPQFDFQCLVPELAEFEQIPLPAHAKLLLAGTSPRQLARRLIEYSLVRPKQPDAFHIVLGDLPHRIDDQVLFLQQAHLIKPQVLPSVGRSLKFKVMRKIFDRNVSRVKHVVVQTNHMKRCVLASYPSLLSRQVHVFRHGSVLCSLNATSPQPKGDCKIAFYPALAYPHKNLKLVRKMHDYLEGKTPPFRLALTIAPDEVPFLRHIPWIDFVGQLSMAECRDYYEKSDCLFFPSRLESYGLPLIEALHFNVPIACSNLDYATELCGKDAQYFDPESPSQALQSLERAFASGPPAKKPEEGSWQELLALLLHLHTLP